MARFCKILKSGGQLLCCLGVTVGLLLLSNTATARQVDLSPSIDAQDKLDAQKKSPVEQTKKKSAKASHKKLSDNRIAELQAFVQEHHPEIMPLLNYLKKKQRKRFNRVVRGLDRDVIKLERAKKKSPEAYQRELKGWVIQSKIRLCAAQYRVADDEKTANELRNKIQLLIEEKLDAQISKLERDEVRSLERTAHLGKAIENLKSERDTIVQKRVEMATRKALKMAPPKKSRKEPPEEKTVDIENAVVVEPQLN